MEMFDKNQYFRGTPLNYILGEPLLYYTLGTSYRGIELFKDTEQ